MGWHCSPPISGFWEFGSITWHILLMPKAIPRLGWHIGIFGGGLASHNPWAFSICLSNPNFLSFSVPPRFANSLPPPHSLSPLILLCLPPRFSGYHKVPTDGGQRTQNKHRRRQGSRPDIMAKNKGTKGERMGAKGGRCSFANVRCQWPFVSIYQNIPWNKYSDGLRIFVEFYY